MDFQEFKAEIVKRATASGACSSELNRAKASNDFGELFKVITDNFSYSCGNGVIDCELLTSVGLDECNKHSVYVNQSAVDAFILASGSSRVVARGSSRVVARDSSRVEARDSSRVEARDSSRVEARGSSRVVARDSSRVEARGSSRVEARDLSSVISYSSIEHKVSDRAILRYYHTCKVVLGKDLQIQQP